MSDTRNSTELLPFPFCGEMPVITKHHREEMYGFLHRCTVIGPISWGFREDKSSHVAQWNRRTQPAEQQDEPGAIVHRVEYENGSVEFIENPTVGFEKCRLEPLYLRPAAQAVKLPGVDQLSNIIRQVDGNHSLGAGALAEKIIEAVAKLNGIKP